MKKWIITALIIIGQCLLIWFLWNKLNTVEKNYSDSMVTIKAYSNSNSALQKDNLVYKFTIDQLNYYNDSILVKLNTVRKELKIKDKDLSAMQYLVLHSKKTDTLIFKDTIFSNKINVDTTYGDKWYNVKLHLQFPNIVEITPSFINEVDVIFYNKKETINPPSKWFFIRWFQKKHIIVEAEVKLQNPYSNINNHKFIQIIK